MSSEHAPAQTHAAAGAHGHGTGVYHATLTALLILTAITVGASYIQFGSSAANVVIALTIASIKAILVALFFMHLLHEKPVNSIIAVAGFLFLGIFLMFCLLDFNTRLDASPRSLPNLEKATPVPDTLNPRLAAPPKPAGKAAPAGEGAGHGAPEHQ
jgi:cytochrome c oxidase subunit 4